MSSLTSQSSPSLLDQLEVVPAPADALPYVYSTWLKSWELSKDCRHMAKKAYFAWQHRRIERMLEQDASFLLLRHTDDPSSYVGWLCSDLIEDIYFVHAVYVRNRYRNKGGASLLLVHDFVSKGLTDTTDRYFTHSNPPFDTFMTKRGFQLLRMDL